MGELDRRWWRAFALWMAAAVLFATLLALTGFVALWAQYASSHQITISELAEPHRRSLQIGVLLIFGFGVTLEGLAMAVWISCREGVAEHPTPVAGDAEFWRAAWAATTSRREPPAPQPEMAGVLGQDSPWRVLGLRPGAGPRELKRAYRTLMRQHHPDHGGDVAEAKRIIAAYAALTRARTAAQEHAG